jgi:hypothetical protein
MIYKSMVRSKMEYTSSVWMGAPETTLARLGPSTGGSDFQNFTFQGQNFLNFTSLKSNFTFVAFHGNISRILAIRGIGEIFNYFGNLYPKLDSQTSPLSLELHLPLQFSKPELHFNGLRAPRLDAIQKRALKMINLPHDQLNATAIQSLDQHRKVGALILLHRIYSQKVPALLNSPQPPPPSE